jgi:hypothetical protein
MAALPSRYIRGTAIETKMTVDKSFKPRTLLLRIELCDLNSRRYLQEQQIIKGRIKIDPELFQEMVLNYERPRTDKLKANEPPPLPVGSVRNYLVSHSARNTMEYMSTKERVVELKRSSVVHTCPPNFASSGISL